MLHIQAILPAAGQPGSLAIFTVLLPLLSVCLSMAVGVCGGLVLTMVLRQRSLLVPHFGGEASTGSVTK